MEIKSKGIDFNRKGDKINKSKVTCLFFYPENLNHLKNKARSSDQFKENKT